MQDGAPAREYHSGDCVILPATRRLLRNGAEVELEAKVFDLILLLVRDHARALGKQELIEQLWGRRPITDAALSQLIYKARRACGDDGERQSVIRTIYGRGLQWVAPVREIVAEPPSPAAAERGGDPHVRVPAGDAVAAPQARRWAWPTAAAVALLAIGVALAWWLVPRGAAPDAARLPRVALLPIENATGDPSLDWTARGLPGLIGSLLGETPGIAVIDPIKVAEAWNFDIPNGMTRAQHIRKVTGASILVEGKLRNLGALYELSLHVEPGAGRSTRDIAITGAKPGELAVAAMSRLRMALDLADEPGSAEDASPADPYLAQTFARGMDAAMHGRWSRAKPYFALCAKTAPDFLPCRLRLAQAQTHTDQLPEAQQTLQSLPGRARKSGNTRVAALALEALADIALARNRAGDALDHLNQAGSLAARIRAPALRTGIALKSAKAAAVLKRIDLAETHLRQAREWIAENHLENAESGLHNAESFVAYARGDYAGAAQADRAALAASLAVGNEFDALADTCNLALALMRDGEPMQALPLFSDAWVRAAKLDNTEVRFSAGNNLATILLQVALDGRTRPIIDALLRMATQQKSASWQAYALSLRSDWNWAEGRRAPAFADAKQAMDLTDGKQDPGTWALLQFKAALLALPEAPRALADMTRRFDALVARQAAPGDYAYLQCLMHALAAAAAGDRDATRAALQEAASATHADDPARDNLERAELAIALATHDADAARAGLGDFDPSASRQADILELVSQWARQHGDASLAGKAERRLDALRKAALAALRKAGPGTMAGIATDHGS